jgi:hypothetical protein
VDRFGRVRPNLFVGVNSCAKILAVVDCHESTDWTLADQRESEGMSMDAPQTVLKTASLPSTFVPHGPRMFSHERCQSTIVRLLPWSSAVILGTVDYELGASRFGPS